MEARMLFVDPDGTEDEDWKEHTVGLFIIPQGQNNISEPKSKSYKIVIIFMIKGPK
jgi:hypothetical protein